MSKPKSYDGGFNIGKPTLRGIRRCPKCNSINGTKRYTCKNKMCNFTFREEIGKKKVSPESCQLHTGNTTRVFSVRMRDKGPDYRGFVQLPATIEEMQNSALCFVDLCQGNFKSKILLCHEKEKLKERQSATCNHIKAAMGCTIKAMPLPVNTAVLDILNIADDIKEEVWNILRECTGPAVQRISKSVMAVKCRASPKYPLGYLHFSFSSGRAEHELQFVCPCSTFKEYAKTGLREGRCAHFYACICAFVDDEHLRHEFHNYIRLEIFLEMPSKEPVPRNEDEEEEARNGGDRALASLLQDAGCRVEVLQEDFSSYLSETIADDDVTNILSETMTNTDIVFPKINDDETHDDDPNFDVCLASDDNYHQSINMDLQNEQECLQVELKRITPRPPLFQSDKKSKQIKWAFIDWLGSLTESINQHFHCKSQGKVNLQFQVPQKFFNPFNERMAVVTKITAPSVLTIPNLGTKYTWCLCSRRHVKGVFDTPAIKLLLSRYFMKDSFGQYEQLTINDLRMTKEDREIFKVFLQPRDEMPFKIEWIPDILPISHVGELKINFTLEQCFKN